MVIMVINYGNGDPFIFVGITIARMPLLVAFFHFFIWKQTFESTLEELLKYFLTQINSTKVQTQTYFSPIWS